MMKSGSDSSMLLQTLLGERSSREFAGTRETKTFHWSERVYKPSVSRRGGKK